MKKIITACFVLSSVVSFAQPWKKIEGSGIANCKELITNEVSTSIVCSGNVLYKGAVTNIKKSVMGNGKIIKM